MWAFPTALCLLPQLDASSRAQHSLLPHIRPFVLDLLRLIPDFVHEPRKCTRALAPLPHHCLIFGMQRDSGTASLLHLQSVGVIKHFQTFDHPGSSPAHISKLGNQHGPARRLIDLSMGAQEAWGGLTSHCIDLFMVQELSGSVNEAYIVTLKGA